MNGQMNIEYLVAQRNLLVSQVDNYILLRHQVEQKGQLEKVMVLIGDGYFVEKSVSQAQEFLDRRIDSLSGVITQFNTTINREEEYMLREQATSELILEKLEQEEKYNEEGLPFMDIVEELDEEDNVIGVTVKAKGEGAKEEAKYEAKEEATTEKVTKGKVTPEKATPEKATTEKATNQNENTLETDPETEGFVDIIEELDEEGNIINTKLNRNGKDEQEDQFKELLEDMEVIGKKSTSNTLLSKIEELNVSTEDKSKIKLILMNESPKVEEITENQEEKDPSFDYKERAPEDHITIERLDLLELEMLADDFIEEEEEDFEEEGEYEFDFDDEQEYDDDEDEVDAYEAKFFGNNQMNDMLWKQINELRTSKAPEDQRAYIEEITETADAMKTEETKTKKEVRFDEQLDIFEIERIKKDDYEEPKRVSRFKAVRERQNGGQRSVDPVNPVVSERESPLSDIVERQVTEVVTEETGDGSDNVIHTDIVGRDNVSSDIVERDIIHTDIVERDTIHSDIVERDSIHSDIVERDTVHSDIVERDVVHSDIVEKGISETVHSDIIENDTQTIQPTETTQRPPKKLSRFKQTRVTEPVVNDVVEKTVEPEIIESPVESELMDMIKAYNLENDEIEGPVIKNLHDIKQLNEMHEQLDVDSYEIVQQHEHDHSHDHSEHPPQIQNSEQKEIVISEKETTVTGDLEQIMEQDNLEDQIKREYFSLKDKLMVPETEQEIEHDVKQSKFRQRLHR